MDPMQYNPLDLQRSKPKPQAAKPSLMEEIESDIRRLMIRERELLRQLDEIQTKADADKKKILTSYVETLDDLDRLLSHAGVDPYSMGQNDANLLENLGLVKKKSLQGLAVCGVTPIEAVVGTLAQVEEHKIVEVAHNIPGEPEMIVAELQRGYRWNDQILRPAEVRVVGQQSEMHQEE